MNRSLRVLLPFAIVVAAACAPTPSTSPTSAPPTAEAVIPPTAQAVIPATAETIPSSALGGEWFCYSYQAGVGTNAVNVSGIAGANSLLGSFTLEDGSTYASFYDADRGTYQIDPATRGISFESGGMLGLEGTYGAGPTNDLIDLHGVGNGWDSPFVVSLICQHA